MLLMPTSCGPGPPAVAHAVDPSLANGHTRNQQRKLAMAQTSPVSPITATGIPKWLLMLLLLFAIVAQTPQSQVAAEKSKHCEYLPPFQYIYSIYKYNKYIDIYVRLSVCIHFGQQIEVSHNFYPCSVST